MDDYLQRRARWRTLLRDAATLRDEALAFGRGWGGFIPTLRLALALETEAEQLALSFAH